MVVYKLLVHKMDSITLTIPVQMLNVIGQGLGELPFKIANPVFLEINKQVVAHNARLAKDASSGPENPSPAGE